MPLAYIGVVQNGAPREKNKQNKNREIQCMLPKHQEVKHGESGYLHARDKTGCILQLTPFSQKRGSCWGGEHIERLKQRETSH